MKGKKILSLVLAVLFLLPGLGVGLTASAQDAVTFSVVPDETTAHPGETITYAVHMGPVSNLNGLQITLGLPDGLTFKQANLKTKLLQQMRANCPEFSIDFVDSTLTLFIFTISPSDQFTSTADGVLMTFTCTVDEGASGAKTIDLPKHTVSSRTSGGTVPTAYDPAGSAVTIMPAPPVKAIELVTGGAAANIAGAQKSSVYFGNYKQSSNGSGGFNVDPVKWRVLSNADGKLFLLSDQNLDAGVYYERYFTVTWETSTIRAWLNGTGEFSEENFKDSAFSAGEDAAVCVTDVSNPDSVFDDRTVPGGNDTADKVFLLSRDEAMNTAYGFTNDIEPTDTRVSINTAYTGSGGSNYGWTGEGGSADYWWLRSPGSADDRAAIVFETGQLNPGGYDVPNRSIAVRPAMNVDLGKVLFTSPAVGGKQGDGLTAVGNYNYYASEWKLTLLDDSRQFAVTQTASGGSATVTNGYNTGSVTGGTDVQSQPAVTTAPGKTVSFSYNGATVGENEYVSAILTDEDGAALYYGRLAQPTDEEGTVDVTIPADLAAGDYTLMLFSEQCNGDKKTDYASALQDVTLTVKARVPGDANKDGQLDMADVLAILYYLLCIGEPEIDVQDADVNGNSEIDGGDAEMIQEYLAGQIDSLNGQKPDRPTGNNHVTENPEVTCAFTDADGSSEVTVNAGEKTTIPVSVILSGGSDKIYALDMQFKCSDGIRITGFLKEEEDNQGTFYQQAGIVTNDSTLRANADRFKGLNAGNGLKTFTLLVEVPADAAAGSTYTVDFDDLCQVFKFNKKGARELFTTAVTPLTINIKADPSKKAIRLGAGALGENSNTENAATVYYGGYAWRVIGYDGAGAASESGTATLLAADIEKTTIFSNINNHYSSSELRIEVNKIAGAFTEPEEKAVPFRLLVSVIDPSDPDGIAGVSVRARLWPLSLGEAVDTNDALRSYYRQWWLRSPGDTDNVVGYVMNNGTVAIVGTFRDLYAVRPAFWLDLNKVLFASAAVGGKQGDGLTAVGGYTGSDWKLTLLDDSRSGFTAKCTKIENGVYTITYSGAVTGENEMISAVIVDENGVVTYYGVLCDAAAGENTLTLDVSGKLGDGDKLYIFNEQTNGDKKTDCASALVDVTEVFHYKAGDTLQYGTYPQSEVKDAAKVAALNAKLRSNGWISYGYYTGTGDYNGEMAPDDFMRYQDVVLDGVKYRAVTFDSYRPSLTQNVSSADNAKQDENGYEPGSTYWFQFEPVTWKVLDPDSGLVLCCSAIDSQAFHNYAKNVELVRWGDAEQKYRANDYAHSSIRAWLNEDFINTAFSAAQQENIKVSELDNSFNYSGSTYVYASTSDKIFLLSDSDVIAYIFDPNASAMDEARRMAPSDYAKCQGIVENTTKTSSWWLRTPRSAAGSQVYTVNALGGGSAYALTSSTAIGVVPALRMQELQDDPTGAPPKVAPELTLTAEAVIYGEDAVITATLPANATGSVTFTLTGSSNNYSFTNDSITDGVAQITQKLNADTYAVTAAYSGDGKYADAEKTIQFTVEKAATELAVATSPDTLVYGDAVQITVTLSGGAVFAGDQIDPDTGEPAKAPGSVTITVDGKEYRTISTDPDDVMIVIRDNTATLEVTGLNAGQHTIDAVFVANDNYAGSSQTATFDIGKATPQITLTARSLNDAATAYEITVTKPTDSTQGVMVYAVYSGLPAFVLGIGNDKFENSSYTFRFPDAFKDFLSDNVSGEFELSAVYDGRNDQNYQDNIVKLAITLGCAHVWNTPTWDWTDVDNPTYTAECSLCETGKITGTVASTPGTRVEATVEKNAYTPYSASVELSGHTYTGTFELEEPGTMLAARKAAFEQYKTDQKKAAEDKALDGDSAECAALIAAAKTAIDGVTYDESKPLDENKQAVDTAANLPQLEEKLADQRAADAVILAIEAIGTVEFTPECEAKINSARAAYNALTDAQQALVTNYDKLLAAEAAYALLSDKAAFEQYKDELKQAAEDMRKDDDSAESQKLIDDTVAAIEALEYDESKPLDENKQAADTAAKLDDLTNALTDQRAADDVEKKINDIGDVTLTDESKQKIDDAREAYDNLTDKQKELVDNKDTLETAEEAYQLLQDKDAFEKYKDDLKQAAEDMRKDDDSEESKKLIDDAVAAIDAMVYDESKTLDENKQAADTAADLDELTEQLEEHRAIHYAVFKADGREVARVPYTIDTKSITAPAVPVKDNYTGAWPKYELKEGGVEINAVYTKNDALVITDNAKEQGADRVLTFMETVTFTTDTSSLPEGATLCWYVNGEAITVEKSVTVESPKDDYTVQVKAFAKDGTLYTESEVLTVKVEHTLWAKIVAVAKLSFTPVFNAMKKVIPSFFSFLIALIKAIATALVAVVKSVI